MELQLSLSADQLLAAHKRLWNAFSLLHIGFYSIFHRPSANSDITFSLNYHITLVKMAVSAPWSPTVQTPAPQAALGQQVSAEALSEKATDCTELLLIYGLIAAHRSCPGKCFEEIASYNRQHFKGLIKEDDFTGQMARCTRIHPAVQEVLQTGSCH